LATPGSARWPRRGWSSRAFAPDLYIPMARAQALAKLGGQVNIVYVRAASAAAVGAVTGEISRLLPDTYAASGSAFAMWRI